MPEFDFAKTFRKVLLGLAVFGVPAILANWDRIDALTLPLAFSAVLTALYDWYKHR